MIDGVLQTQIQSFTGAATNAWQLSNLVATTPQALNTAVDALP
jgi:hypothetical protein